AAERELERQLDFEPAATAELETGARRGVDAEITARLDAFRRQHLLQEAIAIPGHDREREVDDIDAHDELRGVAEHSAKRDAEFTHGKHRLARLTEQHDLRVPLRGASHADRKLAGCERGATQ